MKSFVALFLQLEKLSFNYDCEMNDDKVSLLLGCLHNIDMLEVKKYYVSDDLRKKLRKEGKEVKCQVDFID